MEAGPVTLVMVLFLIKKIVDTIKMATAGDSAGLKTQGLVSVVAIAITWLCTVADITKNIKVWGFTFAGLDAGSILLGGLLLGVSASVVVNDLPKQLDRNDTAKVPRLGGAPPVA